MVLLVPLWETFWAKDQNSATELCRSNYLRASPETALKTQTGWPLKTLWYQCPLTTVCQSQAH